MASPYGRTQSATKSSSISKWNDSRRLHKKVPQWQIRYVEFKKKTYNMKIAYFCSSRFATCKLQQCSYELRHVWLSVRPLPTHHQTKGLKVQWGSTCNLYCFFNIGARWEWVVDATHRETHGTHYTGGWVGPKTGLDGCGKSRPPLGFDLRTVHPRGESTRLTRPTPASLLVTTRELNGI